MQADSNGPDGEKPKGRQYPVKHERPQGQIVERGTNQFMVRVHSHTDANGNKKRYKKTWRTLKEADADLARVVAQKNRGKGIVDTNETLRAFIERFLRDAHAHRVKPHVHGKVTRAFKAWVFPFLGQKRVRSIVAADIQDLYATLQNQISPRTEKPLSQATIQRVHVHLRMAFNWGVKTGELSRHPMENVVVRKPARQKMVTFTEKEIRLFFQKWEEYQEERPLRIPYGCIFYVAFETGMRPEEYCGLQFSDLHLEDNPPHIRVQRVAIRDSAKGGWWFDEPKTASSVRNITISAELARRLTQQRLAVEKYSKQRGSSFKDNDLVFPNQTGEPVYQYLLTDLFREIVKRMGLVPKLYRLYTMRHSMATLAIARKVNVKAVSERLGHADISRTLETYTHVLPSMQTEAVEMLGAIAYTREEEGEDASQVIDATAEGQETHPC
jgi:integrase